MDPLSITALTLAVLDQLWRIGERTAELVSTYRSFDDVSGGASPWACFASNIGRVTQDSQNLENEIRDETNRTKILRVLLFQPCTVCFSCWFHSANED